MGCPTGTTLRELFNSETGSPPTKFNADALWGYGVDDDWGSNAMSGRDSWFGANPANGNPSALTTATGIAMPAGQAAYLNFKQWRLFEWYAGTVNLFIDGGTVEIDAGSGVVDTASLPWVNGPQQTLITYPDEPVANPWAGRKAFAGDSYGFTSSQLDLSSFAGQTIKPRFTLRGDQSVGAIGWWLDDIVVYTCDAPTPPPTPPTTPATTSPTTSPTASPTAAATPPVVQLTSTMKLKVKTGKPVKIVATVKTSAGAATGKVTFKVDKKVVKKTVTVTNGKATLKLSKKQLNKLGKGKHKVKASYSGSATATASMAKARFNLR